MLDYIIVKKEESFLRKIYNRIMDDTVSPPEILGISTMPMFGFVNIICTANENHGSLALYEKNKKSWTKINPMAIVELQNNSNPKRLEMTFEASKESQYKIGYENSKKSLDTILVRKLS